MSENKNKTILILAISAAFVAGSIATGTIVFADDEGIQSLICPVGQAMTGIVFGGDDDGGLIDIFCAELGGGGVSVTGFYVEQDQPLQNLGPLATIIEKQITLDNDATVFISSIVPMFPQITENVLNLAVDDTVVFQSFTRDSDVFGDWIQHNLSWTGNLEAGPHTIKVTTRDAAAEFNARFHCSFVFSCNLNILVFE